MASPDVPGCTTIACNTGIIGIMKPSVARECAWCQKSFQAARAWSRFCSTACQARSANFNRYGERVLIGEGVSRPTRGIVSELLVAAELLSQGFAVFRALSPSCPGDLAILHQQKLLRIEVRTGYKDLKNGHVRFNKGGETKADLYAVYVHRERAFYYFGLTDSGFDFVKGLSAQS